ncbi:RNA polymerase recycling motor HelD [Paenibacillus yanchengensis]|uniref:RNA polymerase recycling motor HelD n=1 Tax=Paenibacillus yanchengensis TaxID=2035833 RepID=A0ABW4YK29_9BACL
MKSNSDEIILDEQQNASNTDWIKEQDRVEMVTKLLQRLIAERVDEAGFIKEDIVAIRRHFWDDVTVNFEDAAETAETLASMKQQAEVLSERERSHRHMEKQLKTYQRLVDSPYFGRVDFVEDGDPAGAEAIYLGVGSLYDEQSGEYLVYDWRAPISSLYYDYGPGAVLYKTPETTIQGEMTLKRQYIIQQSQIKSMFDAGVTIGDEMLQQVLGKNASAKMKSIVATIQQEQNKIIRNEQARLLVVEGAAGSGKTSAALQRAAYLLYRHRGHLAADQIVFFSPNPIFNSYIATVLPELGEENVEQTTYQQYLEHRFARQYTVIDLFSQMEYALTAHQEVGYDDIMEMVAYKSSYAFMQRINDYVDDRSKQGMLFRAIKFRGEVIISKEYIAEQFYALDPTISIANRLKLLVTQLLKQITQIAKEERKKSWVDEELELLDPDEYSEAYEKLQNKGSYQSQSFDDFNSERDYLATRIVSRYFKKTRRLIKMLRFVHIDAMYRQLLQQCNFSDYALQHTLTNMNQRMIPYEDATAYLYFKEKLTGFHTNTLIKHVFIDEAQDYSVFQFHYLKRIFPNSKWTVLGDPNQTIYMHSHHHSELDALASLFDEQHSERIRLSKSYRSTHEIVTFTSKIIGAEQLVEPFDRHGPEPQIMQVEQGQLLDDIVRTVQQMQQAAHTSIAIIGKTAEESKQLYEQLLPQLPSLTLIDKETASFDKGIAVIPVYLAKGVEFDTVIVHNASAEYYSKEADKWLFYTACTRAMHELSIFYTGTKTPFMPM